VLSRDLHVQLESLAPGDLLEAALPAARRAAAEAKYELKIEKEDGLPRVRADRDRAARTLASLFFHARKFRTDSGLSVRASRRGERVIFEVSYHGQPLPHDEARRSLELLYPAVGPKQHTLTAVGLGLGILRAVSEGQGGGLDFHVEPGGNARLTMALPAADR
jgi:K+-sensing histidine kinase KdpD